MVCPNCGEPVMTRHLFCAVCGADLIDVKPEKISARLKAMFATSSDQTASATNGASDSTHRKDEPESTAFSELMHNFI